MELYYFTVNACRDAAEYERTVAEDAFTLSKVLQASGNLSVKHNF
jgi:hypothetical protein